MHVASAGVAAVAALGTYSPPAILQLVSYALDIFPWRTVDICLSLSTT